jgi:O-acetyl-ADP-ribose deacetylase (regulator of RNase III)
MQSSIASCYRRSLEVAARLGAAKTAVAAATSFGGNIQSIFFVCFDEHTYAIYERILNDIAEQT